MSNRKRWTWTDDPSILRNRITALNAELDDYETKVADLKRQLEAADTVVNKYRRAMMSINIKLSNLHTWTQDHMFLIPEEKT